MWPNIEGLQVMRYYSLGHKHLRSEVGHNKLIGDLCKPNTEMN